MSNEGFQDLVVSMLAVNSFSLERAYGLRPALDAAGLFNPQSIATRTVAELAEALEQAGYKRGSFMNPLIADRLRKVATYIVSNDELLNRLMSTDHSKLTEAIVGLP